MTSQEPELAKKSSVDQIRERFDADVDRFSNVETGQTTTMDAALVLELVADTVEALGSRFTSLLDIGCGAGNWTIKLMPRLPLLQQVGLIDLSAPMLERASARIASAASGSIGSTKPVRVEPQQADIRSAKLGENQYDLVVAAAVLHHLRAEEEWYDVFAKLYTALKPGGALIISDLVDSNIPAVGSVMTQRYSEYLAHLGGAELPVKVFDYIAMEDSPRPLVWQLDLLRKVGFSATEVLHKRGPFAAFVAAK